MKYAHLKYNKNGCYLGVPDIYCFKCSGGTHSRMNKNKGKGRCVVVSRDKLEFSSKCITCGYTTPFREENYYDTYRIR